MSGSHPVRQYTELTCCITLWAGVRPEQYSTGIHLQSGGHRVVFGFKAALPPRATIAPVRHTGEGESLNISIGPHTIVVSTVIA